MVGFMVWFVSSSHIVGLVVVIWQIHTVTVMLMKEGYGKPAEETYGGKRGEGRIW